MEDVDLSKEPMPVGMGQAAFLLMIGLMSRLTAKGVLAQQDTKDIIDQAMLGLEQYNGVAIPEMKGAHGLMEALIQMTSGTRYPPMPPASFS